MYFRLLCIIIFPSYLLFFFYSSAAHRYLHSFPTRRSSDLVACVVNQPSTLEPRHDLPYKRLVFAAALERLFRSEEHTSELQSRFDLVCRLLLEKKKKQTTDTNPYHDNPPSLTVSPKYPFIH